MATILPGVAHLQNIHPLLVHFPLAFLPGAALLYWIAWLTRKEWPEWPAFWMLVFGLAGGVAAAGTGLLAEGSVLLGHSVRMNLVESHEEMMLTAAGMALGLTVWAFAARPFPKKLRPLFCLLFLVQVAVMTKGADYGGRMVYDYNAGGNACEQPIEFRK